MTTNLNPVDWKLLDIVIIFLFYRGLSFAASTILPSSGLPETVLFNIHFTIIPLLAIIFAFSWLGFRRISARNIGLDSPRGNLAVAIIIPLLVVAVYSFIIDTIDTHSQFPTGGEMLNRNGRIIYLLFFPVSFGGAGIIILSPFFEELLYRGLIYGYLRSKFGIIAGLLGQGAIFSLSHLEHLGYPLDLIQLFLVGLFWGYVYERTKSIFPSFISHSAYNYLLFVWGFL